MGAAQIPLTTSSRPSELLDVFNVKHAHHEPLCGNPEGWGPISDIRYDFTPCFLDVWILFVGVWGVLCGSAALWFLFKKRIAQEVPKNWHFYAKL